MSEKIINGRGVYLLLQDKEGNGLFLHRSGSRYLNRMHITPGGGVDPGESPAVAGCREALEEIGIVVKPENLIFRHLMSRGAHDETGDRLDMIFEVSSWDGEITNKEEHKCDGLDWLPLDNLPDSVPPYLKAAFERISQGIVYSEFDW